MEVIDTSKEITKKVPKTKSSGMIWLYRMCLYPSQAMLKKCFIREQTKLRSHSKIVLNLQHQGWFVYRGKRKWSPKEALRSSFPCNPGSPIYRWRCDQKATRDQDKCITIHLKQNQWRIYYLHGLDLLGSLLERKCHCKSVQMTLCL